MSNEVKRYDPINSDGTCGMCIEDADYGAYVEYADYATLKDENAKLRAELERRAPDGWKLVPIEPTAGMLDVAVSHALMVSLSGDYNWSAYMRDVWLRMVGSAPSAPKADDPVKQMLLEALNGMLLHIREPESESEFQWPEHFKKQKAAFAAARAAIVAARKGEGE